jgi:hypothetical protein
MMFPETRHSSSSLFTSRHVSPGSTLDFYFEHQHVKKLKAKKPTPGSTFHR